MSLTKFTENTNIIASLPDSPTLTAAQLKAKFDEIGGKIKTYLNNTLTTETEQLVATEKTALQGLITALGDTLRSEMAAAILADNKAKYYVGKIIIDTANVNPATYLGFGEWQYWGSGKFPVGVDTLNEDFNEVEKTGGGTIGDQIKISAIDYGYVSDSAIYNGQGLVSVKKNQEHIAQTLSESGIDFKPEYITCYMWKRVS